MKTNNELRVRRSIQELQDDYAKGNEKLLEGLSSQITRGILRIPGNYFKRRTSIPVLFCLGGMMFGTIAFPSGTMSAAPSSTPLVLDTFNVPSEVSTRVVYGQPNTSHATINIYESNLPAIPSGARDTRLTLYNNPLNSVAAIAVGSGDLSVAQGTGLMASTFIEYGTFTRVGGNDKVAGPPLKLDLSSYKNLQLDFGGAEDIMNINVVYHTTNPSKPNLYYSSSGVNIAPSSTNAPVSVKLPLNNNPDFNWKQVDGVGVEINVSGPTPSTSYTLKSLKFVP